MTSTTHSPLNLTRSTLAARLHRGPVEPTGLKLLSLSDAIGSFQERLSLSIYVSAPLAATADDLEFEVLPWIDPFRLARVVVLLPRVGDAQEMIQSLLCHSTSSASLEIPCADQDLAPLIRALPTLLHGASKDPRYGHCVVLEIPVPAGITLRPGAIIRASVNMAGSSVSMTIPSGHIHSASCNHKRGFAKALWNAAAQGQLGALKAALIEGGSTEEEDNVRRHCCQMS